MSMWLRRIRLKRALREINKSLYFPPVVVFIAILLLTIWPWQSARQNLKNDTERVIGEHIENVETNLKTKFIGYTNVLQGGVGILQSDPQLQATQWDTFFETTKQKTDASGIEAIGYVKIFEQSQLEDVTQFMLQQGFEDFTIHPQEPQREVYGSLLYTYPMTSANNGVRGIDMYTIQTRKNAMDLAAKTGKPALTHKVKLLQSVPTDDSYGFLLFAPVYEAGRLQSGVPPSGYVTGGFRAKKLFSQILDPTSQAQKYSVKVYDQKVGAENLLYQTSNSNNVNTKPIRVAEKKISLYGADWRFVFTFNPNTLVSASERSAPWYVAFVGLTIGTLVFLALVALFKARAHDLQRQKEHEVNLAKDELLSLASHQMRTPATGVKQYLGMVLQGFSGKVSQPQQELLQKAYTSNERQLHVINQILQLAKIESGRIVLAQNNTDLNTLLRDVIEEQHDELEQHGHKIIQSIPKNPIESIIDPHMIRMVLENLVSNAIKYTIEPGTITVKLKKSKQFACITVSDTGIGIESKQVPFIFKQFTRLYDERAEQVSGTGIGLYLADQLIRLHKGSLEVESIPGKGSTFIVSLPLVKRRRK